MRRFINLISVTSFFVIVFLCFNIKNYEVSNDVYYINQEIYYAKKGKNTLSIPMFSNNRYNIFLKEGLRFELVVGEYKYMITNIEAIYIDTYWNHNEEMYLFILYADVDFSNLADSEPIHFITSTSDKKIFFDLGMITVYEDATINTLSFDFMELNDEVSILSINNEFGFSNYDYCYFEEEERKILLSSPKFSYSSNKISILYHLILIRNDEKFIYEGINACSSKSFSDYFKSIYEGKIYD